MISTSHRTGEFKYTFYDHSNLFYQDLSYPTFFTGLWQPSNRHKPVKVPMWILILKDQLKTLWFRLVLTCFEKIKNQKIANLSRMSDYRCISLSANHRKRWKTRHLEERFFDIFIRKSSVGLGSFDSFRGI